MKIITVFTICILIEISYQTTVTSQPESDFLNKNATAVLNEAANSINCLTTEHFRETLSAEAKSRDDLCKATTDKSSSSITAQSSSEVKRDEGFVPSVPLYGEDGGVASSDDMHIANEKILQEDTTAVGETSEDATGEITEHTETIEMIDVTTTDATTVEDTTTEATTEASTTEASTTEATTTEATTTEDTTVEDTTEETTVAVPECTAVDPRHEISVNNELTIFWSLPGFSCVYDYIDIVLTTKDCTENCALRVDKISLKDLNYTFPLILETCVNYEYTIFEYQVSVFSNTFLSEIPIKKIDMLIVTETNEDTVNVIWNYTRADSCSTMFEIFLQGGLQERQLQTTEHNLTIAALEPCVVYDITVCPMKDNTCMSDFSSSITHTMSTVIPGKVLDLQVDSTSDDDVIEVKWSEPQKGAKCVEEYEVSLESDFPYNDWKESKLTKDRKEIFLNIGSCVEYKATVITLVNFEPPYDKSSVFKNITSPSKVFVAPAQPTVKDIKDTSVVISTSVNKVNEKNSCKIERVRFTCFDDFNNSELVIGNPKDESLSLEITNLKPYTDYNCTASVENSPEPKLGGTKGFSLESVVRSFRTKESIPLRPTVLFHGSNSSSCTFTLKPPNVMNGEFNRYEAYIMFLNVSYHYNCDGNLSQELRETVTENTFIFSKARPAAEYLIQFRVINSGELTSEWSSACYDCVTSAAPPEKVEDLRVIQSQQEIEEPFDKTVVIKWKPPCNRNGVIESYYIECWKQGYSSSTASNYTVIADDKQDEFTLSIDDLEPETRYNISIKAVIEDLLGEESSMAFEMKAGLPELSHWNSSAVTSEPHTTNVRISVPETIFDSSVGRVLRVLLLIAERDCGNELRPETGFTSNEVPLKKWGDVQSEPCTPLYQTGSIFGRNSQSLKQEEATVDIVFTIGTETACQALTDQFVCNGPLKPGTKYALTMRIFTSMGYKDTEFIVFKTQMETPLLLISISIFSVMCIVFVIGFYISYRKTKSLRKVTKDSPNDSKDISINEFANFHREMIENRTEKIKDEYNAIQSFSDDLDKTCIASIANEKLNRYTNISPFDFNRVVLNDDEFENDYINASYINGYHYPREYIAAQGPKPNTGHDFWRMVLQHKSESIVMLTSLIENNKVKCHEYFPKLNGQITFDNIKITCITEEARPTYIKRIMEVDKNDEKHTVKHYYFTMWPDHGVPADASGLIEFCKIFRSERQKPDGTIIVHCSAGVGRTGTFIALDIMKQRMKQEKKINIFDLVKQLRSQRMKMVQTVEQYVFLYTSALRLADAIRKPQVFQSLTMYMNELKLFHRHKKGSKALHAVESEF